MGAYIIEIVKGLQAVCSAGLRFLVLGLVQDEKP